MSIGLILNENGNNGVPVKIFTKDVEQKALNQLYAMSQLQFIHSHIAVMPDVHAQGGDCGERDSDQIGYHSVCGGRGYWLWHERPTPVYQGRAVA